ncbi:SPOR domain-containing protein [Sphingomonas sp. SUN019]|uniref:SPOR domain-containing protein n=1 Tax=Sphingomonas sp. SUN019 TaxID=2937788 RepID=UPI002164AB1A|nr:SPOR domain-containing protein [Sphingomonas sp. SUN019]UVO52361.1 SPOR domain-containing protein [Sphingomonas sp. SUN019]
MKQAFLAAAALIVIATPAAADVKAGVDAWSRGDYRKAVDEWRGPATAGDADAQFNMGQAYKLGRGVAVDQAIAIEWYRKAALQNHAQAQDNYALALFQDGKKAEALPWLEKSVARDEKRTQLVLGTMLFNGDAVTKDWTRAYALVTRSSQQGLPQASQTLAQMDQYIPEAQRAQGITLARQYETQGRAMAAAATPTAYALATAPPPPPTPTGAVRRTNAPTAEAPNPTATPVPPVARARVRSYREAPKPVAVAQPAPPPAPAAAKPAPAPVRVAAAARPLPQPTARGGWRVQLGAFRDEGNARSLWSKVGGRVGGSPAYVKAGGVTRLQATGFGSKAAASAACAKSGTTCVVVAP